MGGGQTTKCMHDVIKVFRKRNCLLDKDIVEWKIRSRGQCLALKQDFAQGKGLERKVKK